MPIKDTPNVLAMLRDCIYIVLGIVLIFVALRLDSLTLSAQQATEATARTVNNLNGAIIEIRKEEAADREDFIRIAATVNGSANSLRHAVDDQNAEMKKTHAAMREVLDAHTKLAGTLGVNGQAVSDAVTKMSSSVIGDSRTLTTTATGLMQEGTATLKAAQTDLYDADETIQKTTSILGHVDRTANYIEVAITDPKTGKVSKKRIFFNAIRFALDGSYKASILAGR